MRLSTLPHTWLFDIDGTILKHNGYLNGKEEVLPGVKEFWSTIPSQDIIILLTARDKKYQDTTLNFLKDQSIRFDQVIFNLPIGERILINDSKPSGLKTAISVNLQRNIGLKNIKLDIRL